MNRQCLYQNKSLILVALSIFLSVVLFFVFGADLLFDEFEHLRAAYMVSLGWHPYKDFFEHHHPLLWYLWAPLLKYLPHNQILLLYVSRGLTSLVSLIGAYYIYQTAKQFLGGKTVALYTLFIYYSFYFAQTMSVVFKPDAFMWSFYLCGLYHFCYFMATKKQKQLCIAALTFAIAFCFLQTVIFLIFPLGVFALYILYKEKELIKKYCLALLPALLVLAVFFIFISLTSGLVPYYQRNWILNAHLSDYIKYSNLFLPKFLIFILLGYLAYGLQLKTHQATIYTHLFALMLTFGFIKNIIFLSPFPRYFQMEALSIAFLLAMIIKKLPQIAKNYLISALVIFNIFNIINSVYILPNSPYLKQIKLLRENENTLVYPPLFHIYSPHFPFYWGFEILEAGDNKLFNPKQIFNVAKYIKNNQITYIVISSRDNINAAPQHNVHFYDLDILKNSYELISDYPLIIYKRKPSL